MKQELEDSGRIKQYDLLKDPWLSTTDKPQRLQRTDHLFHMEKERMSLKIFK